MLEVIEENHAKPSGCDMIPVNRYGGLGQEVATS